MEKHFFALIAAVFAMALNFGACAADFPSRKAPFAPSPPAPVWTGFYAGLNIGGVWNNNNAINVTTNPLSNWGAAYPAFWASPTLVGSLSSGGSVGFIGGGTVGYNWQAGSAAFGLGSGFLIGIETDIQGVAGKNGARSLNAILPGPNNGIYEPAFQSTFVESVWTNTAVSGSLQYLGTVRGRVGFLATPTLLIYGAAGLAYGGVSLNIAQSQLYSSALAYQSGPVWFAAGNANYANTQVGFSAGGGLEWMFTPNWSARAEYLYYNLGNIAVSSVMTGTPQGLWLVTNYRQPGLWTRTNFDSTVSGNIARVGVNYHFNWGAASIVARY